MRSTGAVRDVSQGWYDAGDYGKYTPFAAGPIVDLLDAYGSFPFVFGDDTNIPESGNGRPDLLDEVKWELDWLLKMQDAESGGFYHLVYPNNCPSSGSCRPEDITEQRYVEDLMGGVANVRPTASTAKAVAALAHAARRLQALRPGVRRPPARGGRGRLGVPRGEPAEHPGHRLQRRAVDGRRRPAVGGGGAVPDDEEAAVRLVLPRPLPELRVRVDIDHRQRRRDPDAGVHRLPLGAQG